MAPEGYQSLESFKVERWKDAMDSTRAGMSALRSLYPEATNTMPEVAADAIRSALHQYENVLASLHRAGKVILGRGEYEQYVEDYLAGWDDQDPETIRRRA